MTFLEEHPGARELAISLALLGASYLAARLVSWVFGRAVARASGGLDERLLSGLKRPLTYLLFVFGAWAALWRLPLRDKTLLRAETVLVVFGLLMVTLAILRAWGVLVAWYAERPRPADDRVASEFGPLVSKAGKVFIVLVACTILLRRFGFDPASLVVSLGVGSLAIGLAAQDTLANMFAGFVLMADRAFRIGDRLQLATGEVGDIEAIGIRATHIRTLDETVLIIPNSVLVKERVVNQSRPTRHITLRIDVSVAYGTQVERVQELLVAAALSSPRIDPLRPPAAMFVQFGDSGLHFRLVCWAVDYVDAGLARSEVLAAIETRLRENGIDIPYPTRRILGGTGTTAGEA